MAGSEESNSVNGDTDDLAISTETLFAANAISATASTIPNEVDASRHSSKDTEQVHHEIIYTVMTYVSGVLYYLSTCINPLLYNLLSNKYRQAFKSILFSRKSSHMHRSQNSQRCISRQTAMNLPSIHRNLSESQLQSKVSLLRTISKERKLTP